jgi:hypothetical protein
MRRIRQLAPVLLAAIFWIAQVQGTVHGISHLGGPAGASDQGPVPHSIVCGECAALAQAGAAPILALPAAAFASPVDEISGTALVRVPPAPTAHAYRSRAPPHSPI